MCLIVRERVYGFYMFGLVLYLYLCASVNFLGVLVQIFGHVDVDDSRSALFGRNEILIYFCPPRRTFWMQNRYCTV